MGYYTDYEMLPNLWSFRGQISSEEHKAIDTFIASDAGEDGWSYLNKVWLREGSDLTWDDHQVDMAKLSAAFPSVLFVLWGDGQMKLDHWKEYYLDGKCQVVRAEIVYPDFDESQLRSINKECPSCYGEGVLHADGYPSIGCPKCNGEGEIDDPEMS